MPSGIGFFVPFCFDFMCMGILSDVLAVQKKAMDPLGLAVSHHVSTGNRTPAVNF